MIIDLIASFLLTACAEINYIYFPMDLMTQSYYKQTWRTFKMSNCIKAYQRVLDFLGPETSTTYTTQLKIFQMIFLHHKNLESYLTPKCYPNMLQVTSLKKNVISEFSGHSYYKSIHTRTLCRNKLFYLSFIWFNSAVQ